MGREKAGIDGDGGARDCRHLSPKQVSSQDCQSIKICAHACWAKRSVDILYEYPGAISTTCVLERCFHSAFRIPHSKIPGVRSLVTPRVILLYFLYLFPLGIDVFDPRKRAGRKS